MSNYHIIGYQHEAEKNSFPVIGPFETLEDAQAYIKNVLKTNSKHVRIVDSLPQCQFEEKDHFEKVLNPPPVEYATVDQVVGWINAGKNELLDDYKMREKVNDIISDYDFDFRDEAYDVVREYVRYDYSPDWDDITDKPTDFVYEDEFASQLKDNVNHLLTLAINNLEVKFKFGKGFVLQTKTVEAAQDESEEQ